MKSHNHRPRLILVDDNIRNTGGHYFELATLLLSGAEKLGYQPVLAPNQEFDQPEAVDRDWQLVPTFRTRRLVDWSLGVDGKSTTQRGIDGKPIGGTKIQNGWNRVTDYFSRPARRPAAMLGQWSADLASLLKQLQPTASDVLLINTGDDFAMLALAAAMRQVDCPALRIDITFHFAICDANQTNRQSRLKFFGGQVNACVQSLRPHDIHIHATTQSLAGQMRRTDLKQTVTAIPYPTRPSAIRTDAGNPPKAVLAGLPRREKGRTAISDLLASLESPLLKSNRLRLSMHMPEHGWQSMVPPSLHPAYQRAIGGEERGPLEVMTSNLTTDQYHGWLDSADVGIFLYEPQRYGARCSGVLLEMMARGVPVIVPDRCWLADQVRAAGGHRSIGFIYQDRSEIRSLLEQFADRRDELTQRSRKHANVIATRHDPVNTLRVMGLADFIQTKQVA